MCKKNQLFDRHLKVIKSFFMFGLLSIKNCPRKFWEKAYWCTILDEYTNSIIKYSNWGPEADRTNKAWVKLTIICSVKQHNLSGQSFIPSVSYCRVLFSRNISRFGDLSGILISRIYFYWRFQRKNVGPIKV